MSSYAVTKKSCTCATMCTLKKFTQELVLSKKAEIKCLNLSQYVKNLLDTSTEQYDTNKENNSFCQDEEEMKRLIRKNFENDLNKKKSKSATKTVKAVERTSTKTKKNISQTAMKNKPLVTISLGIECRKRSESDNSNQTSFQLRNYESKRMLPRKKCSEIVKKLPENKHTIVKAAASTPKKTEQNIAKYFRNFEPQTEIKKKTMNGSNIRHSEETSDDSGYSSEKPHLSSDLIEDKIKIESNKEDDLVEMYKKRYFDEMDIQKASSFIEKYSSMKDASGIINRNELTCTKFAKWQFSDVPLHCFCVDCIQESTDLLSNDVLICTNFENLLCTYLKETIIDINELERRVNLKVKLLRQQDGLEKDDSEKEVKVTNQTLNILQLLNVSSESEECVSDTDYDLEYALEQAEFELYEKRIREEEKKEKEKGKRILETIYEDEEL